MVRSFSFRAILRWLFSPDPSQESRLLSRWIFLRCIGLFFFAAFYSLLFQARGLIGPDGLLPAGDYLRAVAEQAGAWRWWYVPTVFWLGSGSRALVLLCCLGMLASLLLVLNLWPRATMLMCLVAFVSFISVLRTLSSYQSDGMLAEAAFLCLFFAPPGLRPGLGRSHPASRASLFLLQWLWFRIYFESGLAKILSGEPEWRTLTAMNEFFQNAPLPTWIAWYAHHLPSWLHVGAAGFTLLLELVLVWMLFCGRRFRIVLFWIVTPWQIAIILTSNYGFLNYLVLALGILLIDDKFLSRFARWARGVTGTPAAAPAPLSPVALAPPPETRVGRIFAATQLGLASFFLTWIFYATAAQLVWAVAPGASLLPAQPVRALEPFRVAVPFGLFAVMTRGRYEVEFQGSNDGVTWTAYPFRYKPQDPDRASRIFAPYEALFDWDLWFASIDTWQENPWVVQTEERLLTNTPSVLALFSGNPFRDSPPLQVRAVVWQYWFTDWEERRRGLWWRREMLGLYAPQIERGPVGRFRVIALPPPGGNRLQLRQPPWRAVALPASPSGAGSTWSPPQYGSTPR